MAYRGPWISREDEGGSSPGTSPAQPYSARHEAATTPWATGKRDGWHTAPGSLRPQRQQPAQRGARGYFPADPAMPSPAMPRQAHQSSALQMSVESFLISLPLGDDPDAVEVEARVAERLYEEEAIRTVLQEKLRQWSEVAMELFAMVSELRSARGSAGSPGRARQDPSTLSAIKSAINSFVLEEHHRQQALEYDREIQPPGVPRRVAAPPPALDDSGNYIDTPTVHHHHSQHQTSQLHPFGERTTVGAMSRLGGYGRAGEQLRDEDKAAEVLQLREELSRLRLELVRERAGGVLFRQPRAHAAADGSGSSPRSPGRPLVTARVSEQEKAVAAAALMQAALVSKASQPEQQQQQAALVDALRAELEVARVAVAERGAQATAAGEEAQRLRRALLDAEIELQQVAVMGETMRKQLAQVEDKAAALRASNSQLAAELEAERGKTVAVATVVRQQLSQALSDLEMYRAELAAKDVEVADLSAQLGARTSEFAAAMQQIAEMRSAGSTEFFAQQNLGHPDDEWRSEQLRRELTATRQELHRLQAILTKPRLDASARQPDVLHPSCVLDEYQHTLVCDQQSLRRQDENRPSTQEPSSPGHAADHLSGALKEVEDLRQQLVAALAAAVAEREAQTQAHEEEVRRLQQQLNDTRAAAADDTSGLRQQLTDTEQAAATLRTEVKRLLQQLETAQAAVVEGAREAERLRQKLDETVAALDAAGQEQRDLLGRLAEVEADTDARSQELDRLRGHLNQAKVAAKTAEQEAEGLRQQLEDDSSHKARLQGQVSELRRRLMEVEEEVTGSENAAEGFRRQLADAQDAAATWRCEAELLKEQLKQAEEVAEKHKSMTEDLHQELAARSQEANDLRDQLAAAAATEAATFLQIDDLRTQLDVAKNAAEISSREIEGLRSQLEAAEEGAAKKFREFESLRKGLEAAQTAVGVGSRQVDSLHSKLDAAKEEAAVSSRQVADLRSQLTAASSQMHDLQRQLDEATEATEAEHRIAGALRLHLADVKAQLAERQRQLNDLQRTLLLAEERAEKGALEAEDLRGLLETSRMAAEIGTRDAEQLQEQLSEAERTAAAQAQELEDARHQLEARCDNLESVLREIKEMRQQLQEAEQMVDTRGRDADDLRQQLSVAREAAEAGVLVAEELQRRLTEYQGLADASNADVASLRAQLADSQQLAEAADREVGELRRQVVELTAELEAQVQETEALRNDKAELQGTNDQRFAELHQRVLTAKQVVEERGWDLAELRAYLAEKQTEAEASSRKLQELRGQLADAVQSVETREQEVEELRWQKAELQALVEAKDRAVEELRREYASAVTVAEGASRDVAAASRLEVGELRRQLEAAKEEVAALSTEIRELRQQLADAEEAADAAHAETEKVGHQLAKAEEAAEAANAGSNVFRKQVAESRAEAGVANKETETLHRRLAELSRQVAEGRAEIVGLSQRLKAAEEVADIVTRDSNRFCEQLRDQLARAQEEARLLGQESDRMREQFAAAQQAAASKEDLQRQLTASQDAVGALNRQVKALQQQLESSQGEGMANARELTVLKRELTRAREAATTARNGSWEVVGELRQQLAAAQATGGAFRREVEDLRRQLAAAHAAAAAGSKEVDDLVLHLAAAQSEAAVAIQQADELYQQMEAAHVAVAGAVREADDLRQRLAEGQQQLTDEQVQVYGVYPAKQMLAHQAQVLAKQAVDQQARVAALQRQLEEVQSSLAALAGRSQELVRENAGLRWQLEEAQRSERAAREAAEQGRKNGSSTGGGEELVEALEAERKARVALESLVSELRQQLDGARLRAAELRQRAAGADAARAEAFAEAAATTTRANAASTAAAHVVELERELEQTRSREEQMSQTLEDSLQQAAEQAATIAALQGELHAYQQVQHHVVSGLQKMMNGEASSPRRQVSGGGNGGVGENDRRSAGQAMDVSFPEALRKSSGGISISPVSPSPQHLRAALMVARQRILALEDYLTSKIELEDGASVSLEAVRPDSATNVRGSASEFTQRASINSAALRNAMPRQEANAASLELRQCRSASGPGGGAPTAPRSVERDLEDVILARESSERISNLRAAGSQPRRPPSDDISTPHYSFDDDVPSHLVPGSPAWTGVSEVLQAVVSSDGLLSSHDGGRPNDSDSGHPSSGSAPVELGQEVVDQEAKEVEEDEMLRLQQLQLQQQLVEMGVEVAGLEERLSHLQAGDGVETGLLNERLALAEAGPEVAAGDGEGHAAQKVLPTMLKHPMLITEIGSWRGTGGRAGSGAVAGPNTAPFGSVSGLPRSSPSESAEASPVRSVGSGLTSTATKSALRSSSGSGGGRERDTRGLLLADPSESTWSSSQPAGATPVGQTVRHFGCHPASPAYPEDAFSPLRQRQFNQSLGRPATDSLQDEETAATVRQSPGAAAMELEDSRGPDDTDRDGRRLANVVCGRPRYTLADSTSVADYDGVDFESGGSVGDDEADRDTIQRLQRSQDWAGDQPRQPSTSTVRSSVFDGAASFAAADGSGGGLADTTEGHDLMKAPTVMMLGGGGRWKEVAESATATGAEMGPEAATTAAAAAAAAAAASNAVHASPYDNAMPSISALDSDLTELRNQLKQLDSLLLSQRSHQAAASSSAGARTSSVRSAQATVTASIPVPGSPRDGLWTQYMAALAGVLTSGEPGGMDGPSDGSQFPVPLEGSTSFPLPIRNHLAFSPPVSVSPRAHLVTGARRSLEVERGAWREEDDFGGRGVGNAPRFPAYPTYMDDSLTQGPGVGPFSHSARRT